MRICFSLEQLLREILSQLIINMTSLEGGSPRHLEVVWPTASLLFSLPLRHAIPKLLLKFLEGQLRPIFNSHFKNLVTFQNLYSCQTSQGQQKTVGQNALVHVSVLLQFNQSKLISKTSKKKTRTILSLRINKACLSSERRQEREWAQPYAHLLLILSRETWLLKTFP